MDKWNRDKLSVASVAVLFIYWMHLSTLYVSEYQDHKVSVAQSELFGDFHLELACGNPK